MRIIENFLYFNIHTPVCVYRKIIKKFPNAVLANMQFNRLFLLCIRTFGREVFLYIAMFVQ